MIAFVMMPQRVHCNNIMELHSTAALYSASAQKPSPEAHSLDNDIPMDIVKLGQGGSRWVKEQPWGPIQ